MVKPDQDYPSVAVLGVRVSTLDLTQVLVRIDRAAAKRSKAVFDYANVHAINTAYENPWLRDFYKQCDAVFCDGFGVMVAARILGSPIPQRFTPPDWISSLAVQCVAANRTLFFLGGREGVAKRAADALKLQNPPLKVVGTHHGYFDKLRDTQSNREVIRMINQASPDILVVGFGIPLQEKWLLENMPKLDAGVFLATGAMFDYISGEMRRAPRWITDSGMEWLSRLLAEPRRLWHRYLVGLPLFYLRVLRQRFGRLTISDT